MSDYLADKVHEHTFRGNSFTPPSNLYAALQWDFESTNMGFGTPASAGYALVPVSFPARQSFQHGFTRNGAAITWPTPTGFWGRPTYVRTRDNSDPGAGNNLGLALLDGGSSVASIQSRWVSSMGTLVVCMSNQPVNNSTITIDGVTYRFRTTLASAYDVLIDSVYYDAGTLHNLALAITLGAGAGTKYHASTAVHPTIQCPDISYYTSYLVYEEFGFPNTVSLLLMAKTAPGNGIVVSTTAEIWFDHSTANGAVTSGGGAPFSIPIHCMVAGFNKMYVSAAMDYLADKLYDWFFRGGTFTPPSSLVCVLYTTAPKLDDTGGVECADAGYARQTITFGAYASGEAKNNNSVVFGAAAAGYTIKAVLIRDGSDNPLLKYEGSDIVVATGNQLRFNTANSSWFRIQYPTY